MVKIDPVKQERKISYFLRKKFEIWQLVKPRSRPQERNDQERIDSDDIFEKENETNPCELWLYAKITIFQRLA